MQELRSYLRHMFTGMKKQMEQALRLCEEADGPAMYTEAVKSDIDLLGELAGCGTYEEFGRRLAAVSFQKLGVNRKYEGSVEKKEQVQKQRNKMKDMVKKLEKSYFYQSMERILSDAKEIRSDVEAFARLTAEFADAYQAKKLEKNLMDFSDIEHYALQILVDPKTKKTTAAAKELRGLFEEIMIDEYQDSNYVQETILKAVSREESGSNNIFMVGDVKQSIYRFRLARPELFMEKYKTYTMEESKAQRIDLHKNFRSRREVIDSVNRIFGHIMHEDLGNVEYDGDARLNQGAGFPEPNGNEFISELLLAQAGEEELPELEVASGRELEARMVARRIKEMVGGGQMVTDKETGQLRQAGYRDIVILLRSISGWAEPFLKILQEEGIPAHTSSQSGYFSTREIQTILSMLSILDNPLQDIPLASVLLSPIGGFGGEELARIRTFSKEKLYYFALEEYSDYGEEELLREKSAQFLQMFRWLRERTPYTPIHQMLQLVLQQTGYGAYLQAMPGGEQRKANVDMLLEKAIAYEQSSFRGLFHFVQYIEKLKKYQVDYGEADITSENADVVRIMSIHKSKGLEFPIVFVSGMGKQFNQQDSRSRMILHPEYGMGLDWIDTKRRLKRPGFLKKFLENQTKLENLGEELRVLYVALTRAKEKLVMTAFVKEEPGGWDGAQRSTGEPMDYFTRYQASGYLDLVYPSAASDRILFCCRTYTAEQLKAQEALENAIGRLEYAQVQKLFRGVDKRMYQRLDQRLSWSYPFEGDTELKTKISVSEIKKQRDLLAEEGDWAEELIPEEKEQRVPSFLQTEEETEHRGALRGSAVHKVMEDLDFLRNATSGNRLKDLREQIDEMQKEGHLTRQMKELVNPYLLKKFMEHPIASEMVQAQRNGTLYKEQPFVMGIPASRIYENASEELVLIQGIVDAYWIDEEGITILDYKTDRVDRAKELVSRYQLQLELYGEALGKATGLPIKRKVLYAFHLQEVVEITGTTTGDSIR